MIRIFKALVVSIDPLLGRLNFYRQRGRYQGAAARGQLSYNHIRSSAQWMHIPTRRC